jgi:hypothetical protein
MLAQPVNRLKVKAAKAKRQRGVSLSMCSPFEKITSR